MCNIIIPAFAIERTQEIIYTLARLFNEKQIPSIPVYIDSPLAISATEIFKKNSDCFDDEMKKIILSGSSPLDFPNLHFTRTTEESKALNTGAQGAIIISANGMCTAGRIKHHLQYNLYRPESSIVFVGYQAEGTLGRRLIEGAKQVRVYGVDVAVKAKVHTLGGFSAHADRNGLLEWVKKIKNPKMRIFVVHGEESSSQSFAKTLQSELGVVPYVPGWGEIIDISTMKTQIASYKTAGTYSNTEQEIDSLSAALKNLIEKYEKIKNMKKTDEVYKIQDDIHDVREMLQMIIDEM